MTAATGRADYDQSVKLSTLSPGEPIFVLRAGDAVSADAVRAWAALAHRQGTPPEALELALQQADAMEAWPTKKTPDGPHIGPNERLQLRSEFSRRAWRVRQAVPKPEIVLAEQLGIDSVLGRLRPLLIDLEAARAKGGDQEPALAAIFALTGRSLPPIGEVDPS